MTFRVAATRAPVLFGTPAALEAADVEGAWEHHAPMAPGTPLVLDVQPVSAFAASVWSDGQCLARTASAAPTPVVLQGMAQHAGVPSPLQQ